MVLWLMAWLGAWWWLAKLPALLPVLLLAMRSHGPLTPLATLTGLYALIVANNFFNIAATL